MLKVGSVRIEIRENPFIANGIILFPHFASLFRVSERQDACNIS